MAAVLSPSVSLEDGVVCVFTFPDTCVAHQCLCEVTGHVPGQLAGAGALQKSNTNTQTHTHAHTSGHSPVLIPKRICSSSCRDAAGETDGVKRGGAGCRPNELFTHYYHKQTLILHVWSMELRGSSRSRPFTPLHV